MIDLSEIGDPAQRAWLENVYPLYLHDLTEFDPELYRLDANGRWTPDYLPGWFELPGATPVLLSSAGERIGFALVGRSPFPHRPADVDQRLAEFFVLRAFRGRGLGRRAALALFRRYPGAWDLEVLAANAPADRFWARTLESAGLPFTVHPVERAKRYRFDVFDVGPP